METSQYFERTLFYDQSPAAEEYYARSAETIFEKDTSRSKIEVRVQSSIDESFYGKKQDNGATGTPKDQAEVVASDAFSTTSESQDAHCRFSNSSTQPAWKSDRTAIVNIGDTYESDSDETWSLSSKASSTALPTGLDRHHGSSPPTYPGPPRLTVIDLEPASVRHFIKKTKHEFRVFYIRQRHSYSRLQITKEIFEQLLKSCHVFPRFNEYVIGFGVRNSESEVASPPLTFRPLRELRSNRYHGFECSYILRYIEYTNRPGRKNPWSPRKFAVYHRYKPKSNTPCSTWILVGASHRTETHLDKYTRSEEDLLSSNPFELHGIFIDTAIASWSPYLAYLTKLVTHQSDKATGLELGDEEDFITITFEDHQELKLVEDRVADLIIYLESALDTVSTFKDMYKQFCSQKEVASLAIAGVKNPVDGTDSFVLGVRKMTRDIVNIQKQAKVLLKKVKITRTLISSLLEQKSGLGTNEQLSAVRKLVEQSQEETSIMRRIAEKNSRDSSSMRVLTIITMIYLPCTIVSNFFSTQFVKQIETPSGNTRLGYAQNAWLFFAISVPLTLLTIGVWYLWVNSERIFRSVCIRKPTSQVAERRGASLLALEGPLVELPR